MAICGKCHRDAPDGALFCAFCGESIKPATHAGGVADPLLGQTISGKYLIHQLLGRGGMGDVYKATHLTLDRPVVLKLLKKLFHSDPSLVQRFHREARAASRLNHPNSITIIDFGQTDDGTLFMAMEFLAGRSLERVIAEEHPLGDARVVHMGAQILAALAEAHALGIIHRDLKPANVMIETRRDEPDFVKVLDFGIAKLNEPGDGGAGLTQAGIVCGTPGYMSPEQVRGEELDARSDLYAVGVILYEMLTGLLPFESDTPMGLVTKHLVEDPPPVSARRPGTVVSPELEAIVMRALARDRDERFASSEEMRAALLACGTVSRGGLRPTPAPTSTMIFDPASLPGQPPRPPTGAERRPPTPARVAALEPGDSHVSRPSPVTGSRRPSATTPAAYAKPPTPATKLVSSPRMPASPTTPLPAQRQGVPHPEAEPAERAGEPPPSAAPPRAQAEISPAAPPRTKGPLVAGALVVAAAVAGLVVWAAGRDAAAPEAIAAAPVETKAPPTAPSAAPPPAAPPAPLAAATVEPARPEATATTAPVPAPPEARPPEAKPPAPKPQPVAAPARPVATKGIRVVRENLNSVPTPSASSGDGVLTVVATPWAEVAIDGREIGETPRELRLGAGAYRLRASNPQLGTREEVITIRAGKRHLWKPTFAR